MTAARGAVAAAGGGHASGRRHCAREAATARRGIGRRQFGCGDGADRAQPSVGYQLAPPRAAAAGPRVRAWRRRAALRVRRDGVGRGVGEQLQAVSRRPWYAVLFPSFDVPTARIFKRPELKRNSISIKIRALSMAQSHNDLQPVVCRLYPEVARHLVWLRRFAQARMTGSGRLRICRIRHRGRSAGSVEQLPADMRGVVARGWTGIRCGIFA